MAKRFIASEIWDEDWFLEMPSEYKLFWYFILTNCDHAGLYRVNLRSFRRLSGVEVAPDKILGYFNDGKARIRVVSDSVWLIEDFFSFQYGDTMNLNNRVHSSILELYKKHEIDPFSIRGLKDLKDGVKDKDKDKDNSLTHEKSKNGKKIESVNFAAQGDEILARRIAARKSQ